MTSAISGKIIYKQGERAYLDANIRGNSLVFDLTNNRLLYSTSGISYFEFYPGPHSSGTSPVSGSVDWSNILNKPTASISTSGSLSIADWNTFNNKADVSAISAYFQANSAAPGSVSAVDWAIIQNEPIASNSTSGVLSQSDWQKFNAKADVSAIPSTSAYVTSAFVANYVSENAISSVDWSGVNNKPIASLTTSGVLTSADYVKFNAKADLSAIPSGSNGLTSADFNENSRIVILNSATANVSASNISSATSLPFYMGGYRSKYFYVSGTSAGSYSATIVFNGAKSSDIAWNVDNDISATISNTNNFVDNIYVNNLTKWSGSLTITSGTIPAPGIIAYVEG